jgi:hypothetical protein
MPNHGDWLAFGINLVLLDPADRERIERDRRGGYRPTWSRVGGSEESDADAPLVYIVPVGRMGTSQCRALLHPVRADAPLWGSLRPEDELDLHVAGREAGHGTVAWVSPMGSGLVEGELSRLVRWGATGRGPDL